MHQHLHKNRQDDPPAPSTLDGLNGEATVSSPLPTTQTNLAFDSSANGPTGGGGVISTSSATPTSSTSTVPSSSQSSSSSASSSKPISMGTVIGVCLGAFSGVLILVLAAVFIYRRSGKTARRSPRPSPLHASRSAHAERDLSRSRQERWNKLADDKDDGWDTRFVLTKEAEHNIPSPMEKLTMFQGSPSLHSANKSESSQHSHTLGVQLSAHNPSQLSLAQPPSREFIGQIESTQPLSWDSHGSDSILLSVRSKELSPSGAVVAFPTPQATSHTHSHRWESAEVMHFDRDSRQSDDRSSTWDSFTHDSPPRERRKSTNNPFFGGSPDKGVSRPRSRSRSASRTHSRMNSASSDANPFSDTESAVPQLPKPARPLSKDSDGSNGYQADRALLSLIAALDATPEAKAGDLRVPSMQSTVTSTSTMEDGDRIESYSAFPLPPDDVPPGPIIR